MKRELRKLYNRIKGYDIESLRLTLEFQLEQRTDGKDIHPKIKGFKGGCSSNIRYIQRELLKRATLEKAMEICPNKVESLIEYVDKAICSYGCTV